MNNTHAYIKRLDKILNKRVRPMKKLCLVMDQILYLRENSLNLSDNEMKAICILINRVMQKIQAYSPR